MVLGIHLNTLTLGFLFYGDKVTVISIYCVCFNFVSFNLV